MIISYCFISYINFYYDTWILIYFNQWCTSLFSQLTRIPVNERLSYNENVNDEFLPARFHNIGELEFQHNWGRFWYDSRIIHPWNLESFIGKDHSWNGYINCLQTKRPSLVRYTNVVCGFWEVIYHVTKILVGSRTWIQDCW